VKVYRIRAQYEPRAKFVTYLFHVARNHWIDVYRHLHAGPRISLVGSGSEGERTAERLPAGGGPGHGLRRRRSELRGALAGAIAALGAEHREVFVLARWRPSGTRTSPRSSGSRSGREVPHAHPPSGRSGRRFGRGGSNREVPPSVHPRGPSRGPLAFPSKAPPGSADRMKPVPPSEPDLLAFLRDDLPPEEAEALRARLAAEPALGEEVRRLEASSVLPGRRSTPRRTPGRPSGWRPRSEASWRRRSAARRARTAGAGARGEFAAAPSGCASSRPRSSSTPWSSSRSWRPPDRPRLGAEVDVAPGQPPAAADSRTEQDLLPTDIPWPAGDRVAPRPAAAGGRGARAGWTACARETSRAGSQLERPPPRSTLRPSRSTCCPDDDVLKPAAWSGSRSIRTAPSRWFAAVSVRSGASSAEDGSFAAADDRTEVGGDRPSRSSRSSATA